MTTPLLSRRANVCNCRRTSARRRLRASALRHIRRVANPRRRTDAASKLLFLGDVIADLVRIALPALAAELDLDRIEPLPTEFVGLDRSRRIGDAAYRIPFKERDDGPVRTAVASAEFQDANDHGMLA